MRKWYSLIDKVYALPRLEQAYREVRKNKGSRAKGVDNQSIADFNSALEENLCQLSRELKEGRYKPQPARRIYIDKPDGSKRGLGIQPLKTALYNNRCLMYCNLSSIPNSIPPVMGIVLNEVLRRIRPAYEKFRNTNGEVRR